MNDSSKFAVTKTMGREKTPSKQTIVKFSYIITGFQLPIMLKC